MKSLLSLLTVAACSLFISCNSGGQSATTKKNLEINDAIMKAYAAGDFSKMGDYIAADAIDHGGQNGDVKGLDNILADMKKYHAMMPDMKTITIKTLADDEYVFAWTTVNGTMNGQKMEMKSMDIAKFKDGKAIEHWVYMDPAELAKMAPPPATAPAADSLNMMKPENKPADTATKK